MTVVNTDNESVYEKLVKPDNPITDYNTKYVINTYICMCLNTNIEHAYTGMYTHTNSFNYIFVYTMLLTICIAHYRFTGFTARDFVAVTTRLQDVQKDLLSLFYEDTILLGHSLESDLVSLKVWYHCTIYYTFVTKPIIIHFLILGFESVHTEGKTMSSHKLHVNNKVF